MREKNFLNFLKSPNSNLTSKILKFKMKEVAPVFRNMVRHIVFFIFNSTIFMLDSNSVIQKNLWKSVLPRPILIPHLGLLNLEIRRQDLNSTTPKTLRNHVLDFAFQTESPRPERVKHRISELKTTIKHIHWRLRLSDINWQIIWLDWIKKRCLLLDVLYA